MIELPDFVRRRLVWTSHIAPYHSVPPEQIDQGHVRTSCRPILCKAMTVKRRTMYLRAFRALPSKCIRILRRSLEDLWNSLCYLVQHDIERRFTWTLKSSKALPVSLTRCSYWMSWGTYKHSSNVTKSLLSHHIRFIGSEAISICSKIKKPLERLGSKTPYNLNAIPCLSLSLHLVSKEWNECWRRVTSAWRSQYPENRSILQSLSIR